MQHSRTLPRSASQRSRARKIGRWRGAWLSLASGRARFIALVLFVLLVALTGGSSRPDVQSLPLLRPAVVLFCTYALLVATAGQLREVRGPLVIVAATMVLALLQLIPLPAELWSALPHGDLIERASTLAGIGVQARQLSLDPGRTWNALFALFVPLTAVCLTAIQASAYRRRVVVALCAVALLSAMFGLLQAVGSEKLHLYAITHEGFPVGLFANKNHQAVMLLWLMLAASWLAASADPKRYSPLATGGATATILVLFPLVTLTGSRAGLALCGPVLILCGWLLLRAPATKIVLQRTGAKKKKLLIGGAATALAVPLVFVFGMLLASTRQTALSRLFSGDAADDLRWSILPVTLRMARDFLPFGSGFGSFEKAFNLYEPSGMLMSHYVNEAHDDLLQIVIEGGLPALTILLAALIWLVRKIWRLSRSSRPGMRSLAIFYGGSMFLWLAASLVDYPLRTPLASMLIATLTAWVSLPSVRSRPQPNGSDTRVAGSTFAPGNA